MSMMKCALCPAIVDCDDNPDALYVKGYPNDAVCPSCFDARSLEIEDGAAPSLPAFASAALLALALLFLLPGACFALDMKVPLTGWHYAIQLLDYYPVRTHSLPIAHFEDKMDEINREVNAIPYIIDDQEYAQKDTWETPTQFYEAGGECRDYAIAKYHALYALGVADADMQFVAVRVLSGKYKGQLHAILVVKHAGRTYVLDNLTNEIRQSIVGYQPIYHINRVSWGVEQ